MVPVPSSLLLRVVGRTRLSPFVSVIPENSLRKIVIWRSNFPAEFCLFAVVDRKACLLLGGGVSQSWVGGSCAWGFGTSEPSCLLWLSVSVRWARSESNILRDTIQVVLEQFHPLLSLELGHEGLVRVMKHAEGLWSACSSACSQKPSMNTPAITAETGDPIGLLLSQCWDVHPLSLRSSLSALWWRMRPLGIWPWCHLAQPVDSTTRGQTQ